jgi:hypothetical protein
MDIIKTKFHIVCARYNEDIRWLLPYKHITTVYNKGDIHEILNKFECFQLENVGRESHTYLYHIINNYDNLSEKTIFFQGKIDDHKILTLEDYFGNNDFIGKLDTLYIDKLHYKIDHFGKYKQQKNNGSMKMSSFTPFEWIKNIIGIQLENNNITNVVWGANFCVSKKLIHSKPKIFYQNILRYIENNINPEEGHFIERSWYMIFHNPYIPKKIINYVYFNSYNDKANDIIGRINNTNELHVWFPISNIEIGLYKNIYYTPNISKYFLINIPIINNFFTLNIKGSNDAHILIEFDKYEEKYEIVLGGWNNTQSVIRDFMKNKIIEENKKKILNNNEFIKFDFCILNNKIKVIMNETLILEHEHIFETLRIKNIKIKSSFGSDIFWNYGIENNIKYMLYINKYDNIKNFYNNYYHDYYINKINIFEYI